MILELDFRLLLRYIGLKDEAIDNWMKDQTEASLEQYDLIKTAFNIIDTGYRRWADTLDDDHDLKKVERQFLANLNVQQNKETDENSSGNKSDKRQRDTDEYSSDHNFETSNPSNKWNNVYHTSS